MSPTDAWLVAALGMAVVAGGLVLCMCAVPILRWFSTRVAWGDTGRDDAARGAAAATWSAEPSVVPPSLEPIDADVLAVIATVLEVERTLYVSRPDFRLTIRRPAAQS